MWKMMVSSAIPASRTCRPSGTRIFGDGDTSIRNSKGDRLRFRHSWDDCTGQRLTFVGSVPCDVERSRFRRKVCSVVAIVAHYM